MDALEKDQRRIKRISNPGKKQQAVINHNVIWDYADDLINDNFDKSTTPGEYNWIASTIFDISGGMPAPVREKAGELAYAYLKREKDMKDSGIKPSPRKPEPLRKRSITGSIGREDSNSINPDDNPFGEDFLSAEDIAELDDLESRVLDDLTESIFESYDIDAEIKDVMDAGLDGQDEDSREAANEIKAIKNWLKNHPFNPEARDFEEREWADDEADGQASRYAPTPWEASLERVDQIDWDKLLKQSGLTRQQKEDWELTEDERQAREDQREDRLGQSASAVAERAQIWSRVENGEGFREIAPDYPDYHWTLVRDMSRMGAQEAGKSKQQSQAAERAARIAARERAQVAATERLMEKMLNAKDEKDLRSRLRRALEEAKNIQKRTSNEYQMIRKKQVERWRLASELFTTMPEQRDGEPLLEYHQRMRNWYFETSGHFENLAEQINDGHDISTATNRSYDFLQEQIYQIQEKLNDSKNFFDEIQDYKNNKGSSGGSISGSIGRGVPRGVRVSGSRKAKPVDFREYDAIQRDIKKLSSGAFSSQEKRPSGLNKQENAIISKMRASTKIPRGFFKPRKNPKKA